MFERKQELKYQLQLNKLQMEAAVQNAQVQIAIEDAKADTADAESVRSYDNNIDGGKFVNALRASLRPVVTYVFFITFIAVKVAVIYVMIQQNASMVEMIKAVWDQDTMALFGTVMGFWFGTRILEKAGYAGMTYGKITLTPSLQQEANKAAKPTSKKAETKPKDNPRLPKK